MKDSRFSLKNFEELAFRIFGIIDGKIALEICEEKLEVMIF